MAHDVLPSASLSIEAEASGRTPNEIVDTAAREIGVPLMALSASRTRSRPARVDLADLVCCALRGKPFSCRAARARRDAPVGFVRHTKAARRVRRVASLSTR